MIDSFVLSAFFLDPVSSSSAPLPPSPPFLNPLSLTPVHWHNAAVSSAPVGVWAGDTLCVEHLLLCGALDHEPGGGTPTQRTPNNPGHCQVRLIVCLCVCMRVQAGGC